jgi:Zn-dependent peptidase ImmA (M78 family)/transcriptional regulator with XRE-family HTH domain
MSSNQASITPDVAKWARDRVGASFEQIAKGLNIKPDQIEAWEKGADRPTFRQAQNLARFLAIPFGYLFLSQPPKEKIPLPDLRTVSGQKPVNPSTEFLDMVNDVIVKQQWFHELLEDEGQEPLPFVGRFPVTASIEPVVADMAKVLGINENVRQQCASWEEFLRTFIQHSEAAGIVVMRSGVVGSNNRRKLSVAEFRGFVISDSLAPLIFLNGDDAKAAQIFTLAHEAAHIWIGESGISNPVLRQRSSEELNQIEQFCNRVAAELLIPKAGVIQRWNAAASVEENIGRLSSYYRISTLTALRQAYEADKVTREQFFSQLDREYARQINREARQAGGGDFYVTLRSRNGAKFTTAVVEALSEGRVLHREAARLLGVKVTTLGKVVENLSKE